jgi:hypothetical protein
MELPWASPGDGVKALQRPDSAAEARRTAMVNHS